MAIADFLAPALEVGSTILNAGSKIARGNAGIAIASRRARAAEFEAEQLEQSAGESQGAAMRSSQDEQLRTQYVNSLALARAAASGAGASDPTVMNVIARTAGEGAYRSALAMYEGEAQARLDRVRASALRYGAQTDISDAEMANKFAKAGAASTLLSGSAKVLSMYDKYWSGPSKIAENTYNGSGTVLDTGTQTPDTLA